MTPYSMDLRKRVIQALDEGESSVKVAARFNVSGSFVRKLRKRRVERGDLRWTSPPGRARLLSPQDEQRLCELALEHPDATIPELRELATALLGFDMSLTVVGRRLREMGMTRKKSASGRLRWIAPTSKRSAKTTGA